MEPLLSTVASKVSRNEPRDLLSRLYREIGISAVAAALEASNDVAKQRHAKRDKIVVPANKTAA